MRMARAWHWSLLVGLLLHFSVALGETSICAFRGSTVNLTCSITRPISTKTWFTATWNDQQYGNIQEVSGDTNRLIYNRSKESRSTLTIHDVRESDVNTYLCLDDDGRSNSRLTSSSGISLSVSDLQVAVSRESTGQVILTCAHDCNQRDVTYSWYGSKAVVEEQHSQKLFVTGPSRISYSCAVTGEDDYRSPAVCVNADPCWRVNYINRKICALTNTSVEISSDYSYPSGLQVTETFWFTIDKEPSSVDIASDPKYNGRVDYDGSTANHHKLILKNLTKEDSAEYRFRVITNTPKEKYYGAPGVTLTVTALTVTVSPAAMVTEGQTVTLSCTTSCPLSVFSPIIYIWYHNNGFLNQSLNNYVTLDPVLSQHAGNYSCSVKDRETHRSPETTLSVRYPPRTPEVSVSPSGEIEEGISVTLTCSSDANPPVNEYVWYKKNPTSQRSLGQHYVMNMSLEDGGEYYCTATNALGTSNSTIKLITVTTMSDNVVGVVINAFRLFIVLLVSLLLLIYMGISMKKCLMSKAGPSHSVQHGQSVSGPVYENFPPARASPSTVQQTQTTRTQDEVHHATVHFSHNDDQEGPSASIHM